MLTLALTLCEHILITAQFASATDQSVQTELPAFVKIDNLIWRSNLKWVSTDPVNDVRPDGHSACTRRFKDGSRPLQAAYILDGHTRHKKNAYGPQDRKTEHLWSSVVTSLDESPKITHFALIVVDGQKQLAVLFHQR